MTYYEGIGEKPSPSLEDFKMAKDNIPPELIALMDSLKGMFGDGINVEVVPLDIDALTNAVRREKQDQEEKPIDPSHN